MDPKAAEVRILEAEVAALKLLCEEVLAPAEDTSRVQKSFQEICQSDPKEWKSSKDLRSNLGHLESELLFISTLTGINIISYSKKTKNLTSTEMTEKNIKKVLQRHKLSGNCHMITFQVEFQILEVQNQENLSSVITDLNIIMEPTAYSELSEFVSRVEERRDLFMFFRSLHFFVEWCEYRKRTFKHFKVVFWLGQQHQWSTCLPLSSLTCRCHHELPEVFLSIPSFVLQLSVNSCTSTTYL